MEFFVYMVDGFVFLVMVYGVVFVGLFVNCIFYFGVLLFDFKVEIVVFVIFV